MADAVPSRPGASPAANTDKIALPVVAGSEVGRNKRGRYVERKTMTNGDVIETYLFESDAGDDVPFLDAPKAKAITKDVRPIPKPKAKKGS